MVHWRKTRFLTHSPYLQTAKPCIRWWWFYGPITKAAINAQLDWVAEEGFGGVELAWVYASKQNLPGPRWLTPEWSELVSYTKTECEKKGLICDFTFGTLWPFGGSVVSEEDASRTVRGISSQRLEHSWEEADEPTPGYILNHLDRKALIRYAEKVGYALKPALNPALTTPASEYSEAAPTGSRAWRDRPPLAARGPREAPPSLSALFCDSWEVDPNGLWTDGFDTAFEEDYGYSILQYMEELDNHPRIRYDYRKMRARYVLDEFYRPYTRICHELGGASRVQCHGAPTDLLAAYAEVDIPESEAMLFDPYFSAIPASAAALTGKPVVTSESFSCLYGWNPYPGKSPHHGREQIADMKYVTDALFAHGVNHHIWHGMPYFDDEIKNDFYATVDVSPFAPFADDIKPFNDYIEKVSSSLKRGTTISKIAVYMPVEDAWMAGELPPEKRRPSAGYHWEFQYLRFPTELAGFRPLWLSGPFLEAASVESATEGFAGDPRESPADSHTSGPPNNSNTARMITVYETSFEALYVDVEWMDLGPLTQLCRLIDEGATIILRRMPKEPGTENHPGYQEALRFIGEELEKGRIVSGIGPVVSGCGCFDAGPQAAPQAGKSVSTHHEIDRDKINPLVAGPSIPDFWCRRNDDAYYFFFAHPKASTLSFPLEYGESLTQEEVTRTVTITLEGKCFPLQLRFPPYQSLLYEIRTDTGWKAIDISYTPPTPTTSTSPD